MLIVWSRLILNCNDYSKRQAAYRFLFKHALSEAQINDIRDAANKACVLGEGMFKVRIQLQFGGE